MRAILALALWLGLAIPAFAENPVVKVGVLKFGTVNWLIDSLVENEFDKAEGLDVEVVELAGRPATTVAFKGGEVDVIVTDWFWVLSQREVGEDYRFFPYSRSLGSVMVEKDSAIADICDLRGIKLGVVGGALDKSWLVLRGLVEKECGFDPAEASEALFGAPPLMSEQLRNGDIDALVTYWHYAARLQAAGMTELIGVNDIVNRLGIEPAPTLIGFVWDDARTEEASIAAFRRAIASAAGLMRDDDAEWERLRPKMNADDDAEFEGLRDRFRAGVMTEWTAADTTASEQLYDALVAAGGEAFSATTGKFDARIFAADGS